MGNSFSNESEKRVEFSKEYVESVITRDWEREKEIERVKNGEIQVPKGVAILRGDLSKEEEEHLVSSLARRKEILAQILEVICSSYQDELPSAQAGCFTFPFFQGIDTWPRTRKEMLQSFDHLDDCRNVHLPSLATPDIFAESEPAKAEVLPSVQTTPIVPTDDPETRRKLYRAGLKAGRMVSMWTGHAWRYLAGCGYLPGLLRRRLFSKPKPLVCVLVVSDPRNCQGQSDWDGNPPFPPNQMLRFLRSEVGPNIPLVVCHTVGPSFSSDAYLHSSSSSSAENLNSSSSSSSASSSSSSPAPPPPLDSISSEISSSTIPAWCVEEKLPYFRCFVDDDFCQMSHRIHIYLIRLAIASFLLSQISQDGT